MNFEKIHLDDIVRCYCASHIQIGDTLYALFASENPESQCYAYSGENFENRETLWLDRGGCMSIIPFETRKGEFLAVNEFYLKVTPSLAKIVWGKRTDEGWQIKDLFSLPFLHRFDIYHVGDKDYVICATIAKDKQNKEDWSLPGQIYVAELPEDLCQPIELRQIVDGCFRNHGYWRGSHDGKVCGYFGSDQGVLRITPPYADGEDWQIEKVLDGMIGEIATIDLDGDGKQEMMTIEPFHGNGIKIYHLNDKNEYEEVWKYDNEIDFAHTLVGKNLAGKPAFVAGVRRVECELFVVTYEDGQYKVTYVDKGGGPANVDVVNCDGYDLILAANHTLNEAAIYKVTK